MATKIYKVARLVSGQEVVLANNGKVAKVVSRNEDGSYVIDMVDAYGRSFRLAVARARLAVSVKGRWVFGPYSAS